MLKEGRQIFDNMTQLLLQSREDTTVGGAQRAIVTSLLGLLGPAGSGAPLTSLADLIEDPTLASVKGGVEQVDSLRPICTFDDPALAFKAWKLKCDDCFQNLLSTCKLRLSTKAK